MFTFTKDLELGLEAIDNDHRHLFELMHKGMVLLESELMLDKHDQIVAILDELLDYANEHFAREEAYMKSINDPEIIMQRVQHDHFRKELWDVDFHSMNDLEDQNEVLKNTLTFLTKWLYAHIIGSDMLIGKLEPLESWMIKDHPCEFTDEYLTGIDLIDGEHKTLFEITGKVYDILKEGATPEDAEEIIALLDELKVYTKEHFKDEEEYMESINYEGLAAQKKAHQVFIAELNDIDTSEIEKNPQEYVKSLVEFLLGWLINHIMQSDTKIPRK